MRHLGFGLGLAAAAVCGCLPTAGEPAGGWVSRMRPLAPPAAPPDAVVLHTALLDRPFPDPYLDDALWAAAGQPLPAEVRALLAENGLRAGVVGGVVPGEFQKLLTSELSCVNPREMRFSAGKATVAAVNGPVDAAAFDVLADLGGEPRRVALDQARFGVSVAPRVGPDGRVTLACEPQAQHGDRREWLRPTEDGTGFAWHEETPVEKFPPLAFELTVGPTEYLVIGAFADRPGTLGDAAFRADANGRPRQRVLVLRAAPGAPAGR